MRRRVLVCVTIVFGLGLVLIGGYWLVRPTPRIDQASLDKIQIGEREVIDIIGVSAGNHGLGEGELQMWSGWPVYPESKIWLGQDKGIKIDFDAEGMVVRTALYPVWREYDSHFDMMCQMVRIREKKSPPRMMHVL